MVFGKLRDMMSKKQPDQDKSKQGAAAQPQEPVEPESDYIEIGEDATRVDGRIGVKIETLKGYDDLDRIQGFLREGNVVFLRIRDLRAKDMNELKRSVEKLRKTCTAMEGDMVGVDEDFVVVTPRFAQIYRGRTG